MQTTALIDDVASAGEPDATPARWVGVGRSELLDSARAGREAFDLAVVGGIPSLVMVFCAHTHDVSAMLEALRLLLHPDTVLVGCTTNGQFALPVAADTQDVDTGVVVWALGGAGLEVSTAVAHDITTDRRAAGVAAAAAVDDLTLEHRVCLLVADGLSQDQHELVRGSYSHLGAIVPVVGGCAGDGLRYDQTFQFRVTAERVELFSNGLVGIGLASRGHFGIGVDHGWTRDGEPMLVTDSVGGRIFELDHRPALEVYLERLGLDREVAADSDLFQAVALGAPLGISRRAGEDIRVVHAADLTDGSLLCLADVPQGAVAWSMVTTESELIDAIEHSGRKALDGLEGEDAIGLLVFECAVRKLRLGPVGVAANLAALGAMTEVPVAGLYTYGEIARSSGARGMHHLTAVCLALS